MFSLSLTTETCSLPFRYVSVVKAALSFTAIQIMLMNTFKKLQITSSATCYIVFVYFVKDPYLGFN